MEANIANSKRSEATKRSTKRGDEEREAKAKAKQAGRPSSEGRSRRHTHRHHRSDEERRSKDRARGHRGSNMPTAPGVTQVSNKTGEDRASRKAARSENKQEDLGKESKRRAKGHRQSRSTKPGVESVTSDSSRNRKERSKKSSGSGSNTRPGAETATMESSDEARIARKKDRHASKSRKPPPIVENDNNGGGESDVMVMTATLVDGGKDTEEALPDENQPPNIPQASTSLAENDEIQEEAQKQGFYSRRKGLVWFLACLFLVGIVVAVLFLAVFKSAPDDATNDPVVLAGEESPTPSATSTLAPVSEITRAPSASSLFCSSGTDVQVQEDWPVYRYDLSLTSELKVELDVDVWQQAMQTNFRELLLPAIAGCNLLLSDGRFLRQLQVWDVSLIQLILVESFECNGERKSWICDFTIAFYTGSEVAQEGLIDHIRSILDLEPLETTLGLQDTFETVSVGDILALLPSASPSLIPSTLPSMAPSLGPTIFMVTPFPSLGPTPLASAPPSNYPSSAPTRSGSGLPTQLPSITPSSAPTIATSSGPTGLPTIATSTGPTGFPTIATSTGPTELPSITPSSAPTIATSAVPSPGPSQSPSPRPSQSPSPRPSQSPSPPPSPPPTPPPTPPPSRSPSLAPTPPPVQSPPNCACPLCGGFPGSTTSPCNFDLECNGNAVCHREGDCDCFCGCGIAGICLSPTGGTCFWPNDCVSNDCDYSQDPTPNFGRCS